MYKYNKPQKTTLRVNKSIQGETIEKKVARIVNNNEPIEDVAPLIYTERAQGVLPAYDIRSDRMEIALDAMDKVTKSHIAARMERIKGKDEEGKTDGGNETGGQSTQGSGDTSNSK